MSDTDYDGNTRSRASTSSVNSTQYPAYGQYHDLQHPHDFQPRLDIPLVTTPTSDALTVSPSMALSGVSHSSDLALSLAEFDYFDMSFMHGNGNDITPTMNFTAPLSTTNGTDFANAIANYDSAHGRPPTSDAEMSQLSVPQTGYPAQLPLHTHGGSSSRVESTLDEHSRSMSSSRVDLQRQNGNHILTDGFPHGQTQSMHSSHTDLQQFAAGLNQVRPASAPNDQKTMKSTLYDRVSPSSLTVLNFYDTEVVQVVQDAWPSFRCNPARVALPNFKTTSTHLQGLAEILRNQDVWRDWHPAVDEPTSLASRMIPHVRCEPVHSHTRDKLASITQTMLSATLQRHNVVTESAPNFYNMNETSASHGYVVLPPVSTLENFFNAYASRMEYTYPSGTTMRPNDMLASKQPWIPALVLLLMLSAGAIGTGSRGWDFFFIGITEVARVNMLRAVDDNSELRSEPLLLRCALLVTVLAAFSGDKCQMDAVTGNRAVYITMLSQSGLMEHSDQSMSIADCRSNTEASFTKWKESECRNRLVYSWASVDLELSLFYDTPPLMSINDMRVAIPSEDSLWQAVSAADWLRAIEQKSIGNATYSANPSLSELFRGFTDGRTTSSRVSPWTLRLLLHPIQAMVCHIRQLLGCIEQSGNSRKPLRTTTGNSMRGQLSQVQSLLRQWWDLAHPTFANDFEPCLQTRITLVLYHLISLNAVTSFAMIESLARETNGPGEMSQSAHLCVDDVEEAFFHAGQCLRHLKALPKTVRPLWWPAAIYRVALVASVCTLANSRPQWSMQEGMSHKSQNAKVVLINHCLPDDHVLESYRKSREGEPALLMDDGSVLDILWTVTVIDYCVDLLNHDLASAFSLGIRNRLETLSSRWGPFG
ncbi:hypothetical protein LTR95_005965 [Oleoguttula sp. CCFEE 5521]